MMWWIYVLGIVCNLPIGYFAIRKRSLTIPDGLLAAGIVGYTLFVIHPLYWVLLLAFFGSSTLLTKFREDDDIKQNALSLAEKGGQRDMWQVLANSGVPLLFALLSLVFQQFSVQNLTNSLPVAVAISFAVVNADTWATELGVTSTSPPRWILNPTKTVPRGTSGGISLKGLQASFAAAFLIGMIYSAGLLVSQQFSWYPLLLITLSGVVGSLLDSLLGATIQGQYYCPTCEKMTEQIHHQRCDTTTNHQRGLTWFNNDLVNLFSVLLAVILVMPFFR